MALFILSWLFVSSTHAQVSQWDYSAPRGPAQWGHMPGYETCSLGADQSPIAIESGEVAGLSNVTSDNSMAALQPAWQSSVVDLINTGHTLQVAYPAGSGLEFNGQSYELKQFHFHSPSEHILNERQYPLEVHFVHSSPKGLMVVGVFFKVGAENATLKKIWEKAPSTPGQAQAALTLNALAFLPSSPEFFTYQGSLTTPPCSENVRWVVMAQPVEASASQLQFMQKLLGTTNNRPVQALDGREILQENAH